MAQLVYVLCALTSSLCAFLLLRQYLRARSPLLFWSAICFVTMTLANILLFVDLVLVPQMDLAIVRGSVSALASCFMLYGLITTLNRK